MIFVLQHWCKICTVMKFVGLAEHHVKF